MHICHFPSAQQWIKQLILLHQYDRDGVHVSKSENWDIKYCRSFNIFPNSSSGMPGCMLGGRPSTVNYRDSAWICANSAWFRPIRRTSAELARIWADSAANWQSCSLKKCPPGKNSLNCCPPQKNFRRDVLPPRTQSSKG